MGLTETQRDWLTLSLVPGVGATYFIRLLARFSTPTQVLAASEGALAEVVGPKLAQRIGNYREVVDLEGQLKGLAAYGADLITMDDTAYPPLLAEIYDPPLALFERGKLTEADGCSLAIVGTRKPSAYGETMAERLAGELAARGVTIVSGLAAGIDTAAHRGALDRGGRTIAVLGCGVDIVYPAQNADLMHAIMQQGAVLSSFPMGVKPSRGHFPFRNRIISGLSLGVLVVEAPPGSGALITAHNASDQGREVFALPGQVGNRNSLGPHSLIRAGAKLVESVEDILVELNLPAAQRQAPETPPDTGLEAPAQAAPRPARPSPRLEGMEQEVYGVLAPEGSFVDEIALACRIPVSEALSTLTMLELKGAIRQLSGKRFAPK